MSVLNIPWDEEGRGCLNTFKNIRNSLSIELRINPDVYDGILVEYDQNKAVLPSYEVIIAEVRKLIISVSLTIGLIILIKFY